MQDQSTKIHTVRAIAGSVLSLKTLPHLLQFTLPAEPQPPSNSEFALFPFLNVC